MGTHEVHFDVAARARSMKASDASNDKSVVSFFAGFSAVQIWMHLASQVITSRFRGSYFGLLWMILQYLSFSAVAGLLWSQIFKQDPREFVVFVGVGFAVWGYLSTSFVDGSTAFVQAAGYLKQMPLPLSVFVLRQVVSSGIYCLVGTLVAVSVAIAVGRPIGIGALWVIPGAFALVLSMTATVTFMAYLGARFRDLTHGMSALFQALFVVTPVIYTPKILTQRGLEAFVYGNPFNSMIEMIRVPVTYGTAPDLIHYFIVAVYTLSIGAAALLMIKGWGKRVVYWI